jgi:hypothetical protein
LRRPSKFLGDGMARTKRTYGVLCNRANRVVTVGGLVGILALGATQYSALVSKLVAGVIRMW